MEQSHSFSTTAWWQYQLISFHLEGHLSITVSETMCHWTTPGSYDGHKRTSQLQPNWTSLYQRPKSPSKASPDGLSGGLGRLSLRQMYLERCSVSPGMFLLIHSWTDGSFSMQILLSAFSSRPRCSFTPNKTCALFFVHAVARVHFLDLEPFYASDLDLWSAKTRVSIKHPLSLKEYAYF